MYKRQPHYPKCLLHGAVLSEAFNLVPRSRASSVNGDQMPDAPDNIKNQNQIILVPV